MKVCERVLFPIKNPLNIQRVQDVIWGKQQNQNQPQTNRRRHNVVLPVEQSKQEKQGEESRQIRRCR